MEENKYKLQEELEENNKKIEQLKKDGVDENDKVLQARLIIKEDILSKIKEIENDEVKNIESNSKKLEEDYKSGKLNMTEEEYERKQNDLMCKKNIKITEKRLIEIKKRQEELEKKDEILKKEYDELVKAGKENEAWKKISPEIRKLANDINATKIDELETTGRLTALKMSMTHVRPMNIEVPPVGIPPIEPNQEENSKTKENEKDTYESNINENSYKQKTSMKVYKQSNRFVSWIKEKFNNLKNGFKKNKSNEEINFIDQPLRNYMDVNDEKNSKRKGFIEQITEKGKLQSKEQQKKAFETVRKWEQQNKKEIEQENNNDRDL